MSFTPSISVLLPYFNAELTLKRAIDSILHQQFHDVELILVDNNSSDSSARIAHEAAKLDHRVVLANEARQGVVFASETGAKMARGKYISRMDADDVAHSGKLLKQKIYLDEHPNCGAIASQVCYVPHKKNTDGFARFVEWSNSICSYEEILHGRFIEMPVVNPTLMWRKEIQAKHGLYRSGGFPEDYEMILRWLHEGVRIEKIPEVLFDWHDSSNRLTRTDNIYSDASFYRVKSTYLALCLKKINPFHPEVSIWGASRISRRRARDLEKLGIRFQQFIDIKKNRQIAANILHYKDLPSAGKLFVLSYIRHSDKREKVREFLLERGYKEGVDFLMVS